MVGSRARLEQFIDRLEAELPALTHFILAGGVEAGAALHVARAVCRRAERRMVTLQPEVDLISIRYINRLSDLLFVMARTVCRRAERRMVSLEPRVDQVLLRYVNRLSDLLFVVARAVNHRASVPEIEW